MRLDSHTPPSDAADRTFARRQKLLLIVMLALLASAVLMLVLPVKLPVFAKYAMAAVDLIAASIVGLARRQARLAHERTRF